MFAKSVAWAMAAFDRRCVLFCVTATLLACGEPTLQPKVRPNIVLISVDSLRPDHLGSYGYGRPTSPAMDQLAAQGVLFEVATSSSSWTLPAHASLFTGLPDFVHGVDRSSRQLIPDRRTLAEAMSAAGYRTVGIWSGPLLDPQFGFDQGFEAYWSHRQTPDEPKDQRNWNLAHVLSHQDITGPAILSKVDAALAVDDDRPLFLFVHLWDPHYDFIAPQPYGSMFASKDYTGTLDGQNLAALLDQESSAFSSDDVQQLIDLYDGEVAWTDHQIGRILAGLEARGLTDETAVVVTSDHGEEFFEHGSFGHKLSLFDASIRIPLLMRYPGRFEPGTRIATPVRSIDIAPTLLEWAEAEPLPEILGQSLQPLLDGELNPSPRVAVMELADEKIPEKSLFALRTEGWKLVARGAQRQQLELFDLEAGPDEKANVYGIDDALTQEAEAQLRTTLGELEAMRLLHAQPQLGSGRLPEDLERQLLALGYISEAGQAANPIWADPNPIEVCQSAGPSLGKTMIIWNAVNVAGPVEIWVQPNGTIFGTHDIIGSKSTETWVTDGMVFSLVDTDSGTEIGRTRVSVVEIDCPDP